jgi:hypothetical protein
VKVLGKDVGGMGDGGEILNILIHDNRNAVGNGDVSLKYY